MKKSLVITLCAAALILLAAAATIGVLAATAGQQSGLDRSHAGRCAMLDPGASNREHGVRLATLTMCRSHRL